jgi:hypothetical protein
MNRFLRNLRDSCSELSQVRPRSEVRPRRLTGEPSERERISQKSTLNNNTAFKVVSLKSKKLIEKWNSFKFVFFNKTNDDQHDDIGDGHGQSGGEDPHC